MRLGLLNLGFFAIAIIVFVLLCGEYMYFTIDDSFIFYRYSDNMASGFPFSFNYNDVPEFGFTSYLYTIIVALGIIGMIASAAIMGIFVASRNR